MENASPRILTFANLERISINLDSLEPFENQKVYPAVETFQKAVKDSKEFIHNSKEISSLTSTFNTLEELEVLAGSFLTWLSKLAELMHKFLKAFVPQYHHLCHFKRYSLCLDFERSF